MTFHIASLAFLLVAITGTFTLAMPAPKTGTIICCPPDLINGTMYQQIYTTTQTGFSTILTNFKMNVDYKKKMIVLKGQVEDTNKRNAHYILTPDASYDINDEAKTCFLNSAIPYTPKKCLTDQATPVGPVYFGSLKTTAYTANVEGYSMFSTMTDDCLATTFSQTATTMKNVTIVTNILYSDLHPTVDETVFHIPSFCPKPTVKDTK